MTVEALTSLLLTTPVVFVVAVPAPFAGDGKRRIRFPEQTASAVGMEYRMPVRRKSAASVVLRYSRVVALPPHPSPARIAQTSSALSPLSDAETLGREFLHTQTTLASQPHPSPPGPPAGRKPRTRP